MTNHSYTCPVGVKGKIVTRIFKELGKIKFRRTIVTEYPLIGNTSNNSVTIRCPKEGVISTDVNFGNEELGFLNTFTITAWSENVCYFSEKFDSEKYCLRVSVDFDGKLEIERYRRKKSIIEDITVKKIIPFTTCPENVGKCCLRTYGHLNEEDCTRKINIPLVWKGKITLKKGSETKTTIECCQKKKSGKYLGNKSSGHMEIHDLKNIKGACNINRMNDKNKVYFKSVQEGIKKGFNGCYYCLRKYHTE